MWADGKRPKGVESAAEQAATAQPAPAGTSSIEAKFDSMMKVMQTIASAQAETSAAVEEFKKEKAAAEVAKKKQMEALRARHEKASMASAASSDVSFKLWDARTR